MLVYRISDEFSQLLLQNFRVSEFTGEAIKQWYVFPTQTQHFCNRQPKAVGCTVPRGPGGVTGRVGRNHWQSVHHKHGAYTKSYCPVTVSPAPWATCRDVRSEKCHFWGAQHAKPFLKVSNSKHKLSITPRRRMGKWMSRATFFSISALVGGEWSASGPGRFTHGTHRIGGWVDPRAVLDDVEKILEPNGTRTPTPRSSSP
jgi:hypothetical protein